jgi:hypothetical protein
MMYMVRKKASRKIYGKLEDQYSHLWDYCEILRMTNKGSYVMIKVDTPNPSVLPKFGRIYLSLTTMKKEFLEGCRPVIINVSFLKFKKKGGNFRKPP